MSSKVFRLGLAVFLMATGASYAQSKPDSASVATGKVIFYSPEPYDGTINVPIGIGMRSGPPTKGALTRYFKTTPYVKAPDCDQHAGSYTATLAPGWYAWQSSNKCSNPLVNEGGSMLIQPGVCLKIAVNSGWACPLSPP